MVLEERLLCRYITESISCELNLNYSYNYLSI
nr:MAG TPA: hypothetical protein [Bacteriophage sp.]